MFDGSVTGSYGGRRQVTPTRIPVVATLADHSKGEGMQKIAAGLAISLCLAVVFAGGAAGSRHSARTAEAGGYTIGLLLPDVFVPRYQTQDYPYFKAEIAKLCPTCKVIFQNAADDAGKEQQEANSMLAQGVKVLVVDPVDGVAAASIVSAAKGQGVPVVAYDRLIQSPDLSYVVSNDYLKVGVLQGTSLVHKLKASHVKTSSGGILMMNGADTDNNAVNIRKGALSVIGKSGYKVLSHIDTWDPSVANKWASSQITKYGHKIIAVYSANDGNAGGAISALKSASWRGTWPPITGLDATIQGIQDILVGLQYETTYNAFKIEATKAADATYALAQGQKPAATAKVNGIPAFLNTPQAVTFSTIKSTVIKDGFYKPSQICTAKYKAACAKAGITG